jgi:hypothetical protein
MDMNVMQRLLNALRHPAGGGTVPTKAENTASEQKIADFNAPETQFQGDVDAKTAEMSDPTNNAQAQAQYGVNPLTQQDQLRALIAAQLRPAQLQGLQQDQLAGYAADKTGAHEAARAMQLLRGAQQ